MIKFEGDDEALEAITKSRSGNSSEDRKGDTVTAKHQGGSWYWRLHEDDTPSNIETHYRRLDYVPDGRNVYNNEDNSCPTLSAPSIKETKKDHEGDVNKDRDSAKINEDDKLDYKSDDNNVNEEDGVGYNSGDSHSVLVPSNEYHARWERQFQLLVEYKKKYKTTCVPRRYEADPKLGRWVHAQRSSCREKYRIDLMNDIGFQWQLPNKNDWYVTNELQNQQQDHIDLLNDIESESNVNHNNWGVMYQSLLTYKKKHGTNRVPQIYKADPPLERWVDKQRASCKEKDRIDLLNDDGLEWNVKKNDWEVMYKRLLTYKKQNITTRVPQSYKTDSPLEKRVNGPPQFYIDQDRIDLLNDIGLEWNVTHNNWGVMYQRLSAYKEKHGTTCVPQHDKEHPQLGRWVSNQRRRCKDKDRYDLLHGDINNNWGVMYQRLLTYKKQHGITHVPQKFKADPKLGRWVNKQRKLCKEKDRTDLLNDIAFLWKGDRARLN